MTDSTIIIQRDLMNRQLAFRLSDRQFRLFKQYCKRFKVRESVMIRAILDDFLVNNKTDNRFMSKPGIPLIAEMKK